MTRRFRNRRIQMIDIVPRFEDKPASHHVRHAVGQIQRLALEGKSIIGDDFKKLDRWESACNEMLKHIGKSQQQDRADLATALREFIIDFEHATARVHQMVFGARQDVPDDDSEPGVLAWLEYTFRLTIYALLANYCEDKLDSTTYILSFDPAIGKIGTEIVYQPARSKQTYRYGRRRH